MTRMKAFGLAISGCLVAAPALAGERMTNDEMRALYSGNTITVVHHKRGPGKAYFAADGRVKSISESGSKRVGRWWIDEERNMRCVRWDHKDKDFCRYTEKNDDGTFTLVKPENGKQLVHYLSVEEGDRL